MSPSPESSHHGNDGPLTRSGVAETSNRHPREGGDPSSSISFSEAFSDASSFDRLRASLPEQHRTHLDELRKSIFAFCDEFKIPREALRSKETFGVFLASPKIPPARMVEAVSLFARLEHLVTNKEPLKEEETAIEYMDRLYHLTEQYTSQVSLLERIGILKDGVITGIDGNDYPIPTLEQIVQRLLERESDLSTKRNQGFTKLLLVPFGISLDTLRETLKQFFLDYKQIHPTFGRMDPNIPNDSDKPSWDPFHIWEEGYLGADTDNPPKIYYYPTSFDKDHHQGQTKLEILEAQADNPEDSFPGWKVHLLQSSNLQDLGHSIPKGIAFIPRQGRGKTQGEDSPRPDLEADKTPKEYLSIFQQTQVDKDSPYFQESGLTPEDWMVAFMTHFEETGKPLDENGSSKKSITYLTGAFFPSIAGSSTVPCAYWDWGLCQISLIRSGPRARDRGIGVRTSVIV